MLPAERDNCLKWDGSTLGHYEVYYLKLNHRESGCAWWLRYTVLAPHANAGHPVAELWGIFFDPHDPPRNDAFKATHPATDAHWGTDPFVFGIGEKAELRHGSAHGELLDDDRVLAWDLTWEPNSEALHHFPIGGMYTAPVPKTKVLSPNYDVRFHGTITAGGQTYTLTGEPGQQTHLWGTQHANEWVWANCNTFEGHPSDCFFEGLSGQIKLGPVKTPFTTVTIFEIDGERFKLNGLWTAYRAHSKIALPTWFFSAHTRDVRLSGTLTARHEDFVGVEYTDPDGAKLWCNNTKVADCEIDFSRKINGRWTEPLILQARQGAALEFVARHTDPAIPIRI
jgi:hypothetical protein